MTADPIADAEGWLKTYENGNLLRDDHSRMVRALIALAKRAMPPEDATPGGWCISRLDGSGVWASIHGHQRFTEAVSRLEQERVAFKAEPI